MTTYFAWAGNTKGQPEQVKVKHVAGKSYQRFTGKIYKDANEADKDALNLNHKWNWRVLDELFGR